MDTKKVNLFVFDTKQNFERSKKYLGEEGSAFKRIICVEDSSSFDREFNILNDDELAFMVVHCFYTDKISGIRRFAASTINKRYPNLGFMYISEGDTKVIQKLMIDEDLKPEEVYKYHQVQSCLEDEKLKVYKKTQIIQLSGIESATGVKNHQISVDNNHTEDVSCKYAIITALEEDEMERVLPMITKTGSIQNDRHLIEYGYLTSKPDKTIAYASQISTGMVDAAILATEMLIKFKPKFLIMTGVLGGKPEDVKIGDVVVATKVFTIDKGKISDLGFKKEIESSNTGNAYITRFIREKEDIARYIRSQDSHRKNTEIHFGPISCVRQVIDIEGYFEKEISSVDRKAVALEMESYGVSRACELINDGKTIPLIIKSVMDNTQDKEDRAKPFAAWTSAMFTKYILENDLI